MIEPKEIRLTLRPEKRNPDQPDAWYRLRGLLLFIILISVILTWWRGAAVQCAREDGMTDALMDSGFNPDQSSAAPVWLCRLIGWNHLCPYRKLHPLLRRLVAKSDGGDLGFRQRYS